MISGNWARSQKICESRIIAQAVATMPTRTILVVEDDPNDENMTLRALRNSAVPCTVVVAHTAPEAMDYLSRRGRFHDRLSPDPCVVFMDNTLPGSGGYELVIQIRQIASLRSMPLVVLSGSSDETVIERCLRAGANSFIEKPMDLTDYVTTVGAAARYWVELNLGPQTVRRAGSLL